MPASTLPPAAPIPVSAEVRLTYVLRHFRLAYPSCPAVTIGYAGTQPQIEITEASGDFFSENDPYPPAPNWRKWLGQQVPFFYDNASNEPLFTYAENKVIISADIISAAFYLLSGWQEYFSTERDSHGRFPYAASVQQHYNFVKLPVVNYYFDVLKMAVEYISGQPLHPRHWGSKQADFAAFISHDVDNLYSAWKAPAKAALQQYKFGRFSKLLWRHLTQPDAWNNLEVVATTMAQYGATSTFFILPNAQKAVSGIPNADYQLTHTLWQRLRELKKHGYELALHGSLDTATEPIPLVRDLDNFQYEGSGIRFHYLCWNPARTISILDAQGFDYDTTLGFAEHFGFRNSYCIPFYPFDFATKQAANFLEIPLNVMDATLHHPNYLQLAPSEILPALQPVFTEIKRFGGVASVLWHNENFDPSNTTIGPQQFHELMTHLQQQGAAFLTGHEIWQEVKREAPGPIYNS
jgi:peptidoglycan/xylan/chitin deacetylase (PgdA/CDA1 family)